MYSDYSVYSIIANRCIVSIVRLLFSLVSHRRLALKAVGHPVDRLADVHKLDEWLFFFFAAVIPNFHKAHSLQRIGCW